MIPDQRLSSINLEAELLSPRDVAYSPRTNYSLGGVQINDPSQGLQTNVWVGEQVDGTIYLSTDGVAPTPVVTDTGITEFQFTFDQNMRPFVCWVAEGQSKFYWYNSLTEDFEITLMDPDVVNPRCVLDDPRDSQLTASDIILAYLRGTSLYFRAQRDRYQVEYFLRDGVEELVSLGMGVNNRLQFQVFLEEGAPIDNAPSELDPITYQVEWSDIGNVAAVIDNGNYIVTLPSGSGGTDGSNVGSQSIDFRHGQNISIAFDRAYQGSWYDDDYTDSGFIVYAFFDRVTANLVTPTANWTYRRLNLTDNGSGIGVWFRRTYSLPPAVIIMYNGVSVQSPMTEVNPGGPEEDDSASIRIEISPVMDTVRKVDVYINGVHRWTQNAVSQSFPDMPLAVGSVAGHFHRYAGNGSIWASMANTVVTVTP